MKFDKVLPALRAGEAIRRRSAFFFWYIGYYQLIGDQLYDKYENYIDAIDVYDLLADDWEIGKE